MLSCIILKPFFSIQVLDSEAKEKREARSRSEGEERQRQLKSKGKGQRDELAKKQGMLGTSGR